jgi:hypothetical protein
MGVVDPAPRRSTAKRVTARIAVGVVVVMVLAGGLAFWNPWHLVVVDRVLRLPGVALVSAIVFGCAVAMLPVPAGSSSDFTPGRRALAAFSVPLLSLQMWAMAVPGWPNGNPHEVARSPDGQRAVVLHRSFFDRPCLSLWAGRGLGTRVAGTFGDPGDEPVVTFDSRDLVVVWVDRVSPPSVDLLYEGPSDSVPRRERFELRLDPATGRPLDKLREPC